MNGRPVWLLLLLALAGDACAEASAPAPPAAPVEATVPVQVPAAVPVVAPAPAPAPGRVGSQRSDGGGTSFTIVSRQNGQCLDVENGALADGAKVRAWPCNGASAQTFRVESDGGGFFHLVNAGSGKLVQVAGGTSGEGAGVEQASRSGAARQDFAIRTTSSGWVRLDARPSGLSLGLGAPSSFGTEVHQGTWAASPGQEWRLEPVGIVKVINKNSGKVFEVKDASTAESATVWLWEYRGGDAQHFTWTHVGDGFYRVTSVASQKALAADCAGAGDPLVQSTWSGAACQTWRLELHPDGYLELVNRQSGRALDVSYCATANGTTLQAWDRLDNDCQRFRLEAAGFTASPADVGAHDPHVIKQGAYYYLTTTGGRLGIRRSTDLVTWSHVGEVFATLPAWIDTELGHVIPDLWAPDIAHFNGQYWLYYSASVFGTNESAIGVASTPTLDPGAPGYGWVDHGMVIRTRSGDDYNAIDANVTLDAAGTPWLALGSFWSGIHMRRLDPATGKLAAADPRRYDLASRPSPGAVEGSSVLHAHGAYYLFVSYDSCCSGADSTYRVMVGRAAAITGPYLDRQGQPMTAGNAESLLVGIDHWRGPGGGTAFLDGDVAYYAYHYYDATDHGAPKLQVRRVAWQGDWPVLEAPLQ